MFFVCAPMVDNSPKLSEVKDGKQTISFYDGKLGGMRSVTSTPDKIDEFLKKGYEEDKSIRNNGIKKSVTTGIVGALSGVGISLLGKGLGKKFGSIGSNAVLGLGLALVPAIKNLLDRSSASNSRVQNFIENNK